MTSLFAQHTGLLSNTLVGQSPFRNMYHSNLTPPECAAIKELKSNPNIIMKPEEKVSAMVIGDRFDYIREGYGQLSNLTFY